MEIRNPATEEEFRAYYMLRWKILREPLGMDKAQAMDLHDEQGHHLAAFLEGRLVGVGRLHRVDPETAQIRYMAVDPEHAGKGVGRLLVDALVEQARRTGFTRVILNARREAFGFYAKAGFEAESGWFLQHNIPHKRMGRILGKAEAEPEENPG